MGEEISVIGSSPETGLQGAPKFKYTIVNW